ncbi:MAG: hypothetical protein RI947_115 [Candidatus Parcubacteria bacterium]|jgi:putative transposase
MPIREEQLFTGSIYHIYNRTIDKKHIFSDHTNATRFLEGVQYYRSSKATIGLADYYRLDEKQQANISQQVEYKKYHSVAVLAYCLMPTHFHLLIKQQQEDGIRNYMSKVTNAFTRYYNIKSHRGGSLFQSRFNAVCVRTDEQLMHVSRYIHLNPYSGNISFTLRDLQKYKWSSYADYIEENAKAFIETRPVLKLWKLRRDLYQKFVEQNADYQRMLEYPKHKVE